MKPILGTWRERQRHDDPPEVVECARQLCGPRTWDLFVEYSHEADWWLAKAEREMRESPNE